MRISVVICTKNRARQLSRSLESLLKLDAPFEWELVVVDNGSHDDTQEVLAQFRPKFPHQFISTIESARGTGAARNRGWRVASGEIVAYVDDDCYPEAGYLSAVNECFVAGTNVGVLAGRILLFDPTDYPITIRTEPTAEAYRPGAFIDVGFFQTANCAFRRLALEEVGGFDERFGPGAFFVCEDADVVARISAAGWNAHYDPRPVVLHHHGRKSKADVERLVRVYDRGRGAFYAKCLLNPSLRAVYAKHWYWNMRARSLRTAGRELAAAIEFWVRTLVGTGQSRAGLNHGRSWKPPEPGKR